jgi:hypothetical protein
MAPSLLEKWQNPNRFLLENLFSCQPVARIMRCIVFCLMAVLLTGCVASENGAIGGPAGQPTRHDLASNSLAAVPAGKVLHYGFSITRSSRADYQVVMKDDSAIDVGFVQDADLAEYQQGQQVTVWAYQQNTQGTQQGAELPAGQYDLVIHCTNSFADCDLNYSLWVTF